MLQFVLNNLTVAYSN